MFDDHGYAWQWWQLLLPLPVWLLTTSLGYSKLIGDWRAKHTIRHFLRLLARGAIYSGIIASYWLAWRAWRDWPVLGAGLAWSLSILLDSALQKIGWPDDTWKYAEACTGVALGFAITQCVS